MNTEKNQINLIFNNTLPLNYQTHLVITLISVGDWSPFSELTKELLVLLNLGADVHMP